ncbi:MAG: alpha-mannosidase [Clostridia bacterium]|nr:alpha-mannosidase [Clostridia bacterium]
MQAQSMYRKVTSYLTALKKKARRPLGMIESIGILPCDYKTSNDLPDASLFMPYQKEQLWGCGVDTHSWFLLHTPAHKELGDKQLLLQVYTDHNGWDPNNPQFLVYVDGEMLQGLDTNHREILLDPKHTHEIYLYAYTGAQVKQSHFYAELFAFDNLVEKLYYDIKVPYDSLSHLEIYSNEYQNILAHLDSALNKLEMLEYESETPNFMTSIQEASKYMDEVFYGEFCGQLPHAPKTICIGHTHIDCAWLWTLKQTREKVQRSFSSVVELMSRYPEYRFMSSQALLYQYLKEEAPKLYERVKQLIRDGRWECEGGMWVEADCNLPSGESLVRQVLYGKRFFKEEFDVENRVLWLPDVFGYSAALPQILRKSGIEWFVTSKISWNDCNKMPYDTFDWQGIDGSRIHSYFMTAQDKVLHKEPKNVTYYVAHTTPAMVAGTIERYQQKNLNNEALLTFGFGDGGGGPTVEHLEMQRRLSYGIPGTPKTEIDFAGNFLSRLSKKIENNPRLPIWRGELYLEFHRGTYTSVFKNKKNNRMSEFLYQNSEWASTIAKLLCNQPFPKTELHRGWKMILTNQFHDIIPGSSIGPVYDQCDIDYCIIKEIGEKCLTNAKKAISDGISKDCGYVIFNPNGTVGNGLIDLDGTCAYVENIPTKGYACVKSPKTENSILIGKNTLENTYFRLHFDEDMLLTSIYDKRSDREVLANGARGNELRIYADYPDRFDAWEWQEFSSEGPYRVLTDVQSCTPVQNGVRAGFCVFRRHMESTVKQTIWLYDDIDRIDFETDVDWHQNHQMLKAAFPVDINSDRATFEIQYGSIERPTHKNTSWDAMKFETCAHKFVDFSEGGYGVSLLNDCKYGHDIHGNEMVISLIKSPTYPDPNADQGHMSCTYSLVPHAGAVDLARISSMAYALNNPMQVMPANGKRSVLPERFSVIESNKPNIICEVVKESEDGEDTILRLYENSNTKTKATLSFGFHVASVSLCDLIEKEIQEILLEGSQITLEFGPFEIHTLKIKTK